jgi:hypothetical protein
MNEEIKQMRIRIRALRVEVPAAVADDVLATFETVEQRLADLRDAIAALPKVYAEVADDECMHSNIDEANTARKHARRVAGLEEK